MEPSHRSIEAGEIVTVTSRLKKCGCHDQRISWSGSGGELNTIEDNQIAHIQFNTPGVYEVKARFYLEGKLVDISSVLISVSPLT